MHESENNEFRGQKQGHTVHFVPNQLNFMFRLKLIEFIIKYVYQLT